MSPLLILVIVLAVLALLLLIEVPVAFSLAASGLLGVVLLRDFDIATGVLSTAPFSSTARFGLIIIPMFILMGLFVTHAGIANELFDVISRVVGRRLPGGLAVATVIGCAGFAAVTGSSVATAATLGRTAIGEMRRLGYSGQFAAGVVASAGTLGILIPPSIVLVIYGILTGEPIGLLLMAGILPGVLSAILYAALIVIRAKWGNARVFVPTGGESDARGESDPSNPSTNSTAGFWRSMSPVLYLAVLFFIVIGGIYSGIVTATEAGAIGAFAALAMLAARFARQPTRLWGALRESLKETASTTSMIFMLLIGGAIFTYFLVASRTPVHFTEWILSLEIAPSVVIALILLAMIPLGMVLDGLSILLIVVPLTYPVAIGLGFDGLWFGVLVVKMIEVGLITPPVGIGAYVVAGVAGPEVSAEDVFRGSAPFLITDVLTVAVLFALPGVVTWLPAIAGAG